MEYLRDELKQFLLWYLNRQNIKQTSEIHVSFNVYKYINEKHRNCEHEYAEHLGSEICIHCRQTRDEVNNK